MAPAPIIVLWTVPRSVSTAFERMMMERGDVKVVHEPFSRHYYFGPDRGSGRYDELDPAATGEQILEELTAAASDRPIFMKEMAYHVRSLAGPAFLDRFVHTFLIRDPARTLPSLSRHWPDFTDEEAGYDALGEVYAAVRDQEPAVIESEDLLADPSAIVAAYCDRIDLPFRHDALTWEPGMPAAWELWEDWHREAASSTGFGAPPAEPPAPLEDPRLIEIYERCAPIYRALHERRLRPTSGKDASSAVGSRRWGRGRRRSGARGGGSSSRPRT